MSIFELPYKPLAKELVGKTMVVGQHRVTIMDAQGYPRSENDTGVYKPVVDMQPGEVFVPRHRNAFLFLIACKDGENTGGCVLVREIELDGHLYKGPGTVTQALGIQTHAATGKLHEREIGELSLSMDGVAPPADPPRDKAAKARKMSEALLSKHMPNIVKAWKKSSQGTTFLDFTNKLVAECPDEAALRKRLRELMA